MTPNRKLFESGVRCPTTNGGLARTQFGSQWKSRINTHFGPMVSTDIRQSINSLFAIKFL